MPHIRIHPQIQREHIPAILSIDKEAFEAEFPAAVKVAEERPWAYTVMTFGNKVIGYGLVVPLSNFATEALKRGEIDETEILEHNIRLPDQAASWYVASIATRKGTPAALRSRLVGYTLGGVLRSDKPVLAVPVSRDGDRIAREVGLNDFKMPQNQFRGLKGYNPSLFFKGAFLCI